MKKSIKNQIKAEFFEFLRENDCASKFCVNFYHENGKKFRNIFYGNKTKNIEKYLNEALPRNWIYDAFNWNETQENYDYWEYIKTKWSKQLEAIEYNIQKSKNETNSH